MNQATTEKATKAIEILTEISKLEKEGTVVQQELLDQFYKACDNLTSSLDGCDYSEKLQKLKDELVEKKEEESSLISSIFKEFGSIFSGIFRHDDITSSNLVPRAAKVAKAVGKFLFTSIGVKFIEGVSTGAGINIGNQLSEDARKNYDQLRQIFIQTSTQNSQGIQNYDMEHLIYNE